MLAPDGIAVVHDGPAGCAVMVAGEPTVVPGFPQQPVDTNGAGDCHTGVMLAARMSGASWPEACRRANAAAAIKVTRRGPTASPSHDELEAFLADL